MWLIPARPFGPTVWSKEEVKADEAKCTRLGNCGYSFNAIYMGNSLIDRIWYIPFRDIERVFKRVAMSKGGFSGKGVFGTLPFLVVQFGSGLEKECPFKLEADVDRLLAAVEQEHPGVPTHSVKAGNRLARAEAAEEARYLKELPEEAAAAVQQLRGDQDFLALHPSLSEALPASARQKRVTDNLNPAYIVAGAILGVLGLLAVAWGLYSLLTHGKNSMYFIIGGGALFFMTLSSNTFPSKWNSRKVAQRDWDQTVEKMRNYLKGRPGFSVPAQYAHPVVLERMIRLLREGRAANTAEALALMKENLRALNSSVTVSQKEHDEVVRIKPLFLVCDYQDEI